MQDLITRLQQPIAFCLAMLLVAPAAVAQTTLQATSPVPQVAAEGSRSQSAPDGSGIFESDALVRYPDSPGAALAPSEDQDQQGTKPVAPAAQATQQNPPQQPVGTAAAPYEKPEGAPASRPAGAAIAPAKQRRIRTVSIRVALIAGAAVAIGVVTAASLSSPRRAN